MILCLFFVEGSLKIIAASFEVAIIVLFIGASLIYKLVIHDHAIELF